MWPRDAVGVGWLQWGLWQKRERAQHAHTWPWGCAGCSQHSGAVCVPIAAGLWLYQKVQLEVEQGLKKQRLECQHQCCVPAGLCGSIQESGYLCIFWVFGCSQQGCSSWSRLVMNDSPSAAFYGKISVGSKKHCTPWRLWSAQWRSPGVMSHRGRSPLISF